MSRSLIRKYYSVDFVDVIQKSRTTSSRAIYVIIN